MNALNALLIVDPDNDQYTGDGGDNAPNSVMYCPVSWDGSRYTISGIWGQDGVVESRYRALAKMEGGNPPATTYKIAFYANGGKGSMSDESFTYGKSKKLSANKFTRKGYKFAGWARTKTNAKNGLPDYKNKAKVKNLVMNGKTVKLYAVWQPR